VPALAAADDSVPNLLDSDASSGDAMSESSDEPAPAAGARRSRRPVRRMSDDSD
jgi:hypothetical protein